MGRISTKVGYRLQIGKKSILENRTSFCGKRTPVATFTEDANIVLLKHQKGIPNCWRVRELLNPRTVQNLKTSEKQIGEKIYLTKTKVSSAIKSLKIDKVPGENDI